MGGVKLSIGPSSIINYNTFPRYNNMWFFAQCPKSSVRSPVTRCGWAKLCWASRTWYRPDLRNLRDSRDIHCSPTTGRSILSSIPSARYGPTCRTQRCWRTTCWSPTLRGVASSGETWVYISVLCARIDV